MLSFTTKIFSSIFGSAIENAGTVAGSRAAPRARTRYVLMSNLVCPATRLCCLVWRAPAHFIDYNCFSFLFHRSFAAVAVRPFAAKVSSSYKRLANFQFSLTVASGGALDALIRFGAGCFSSGFGILHVHRATETCACRSSKLRLLLHVHECRVSGACFVRCGYSHGGHVRPGRGIASTLLCRN